MKEKENILVAKFGSSSVTDPKGMDEQRIYGYAQRLAQVSENTDSRLIIVSSGSVVAGQAIYEERVGRRAISLQTAASVGSSACFLAWDQAFKQQNRVTGSVMVTHREIDDGQDGRQLRKTLNDNIEANVVTIINENDSVSNIELAKLKYGGDNDGLASHIGRALGASTLLLFTDTVGVLDQDGRLIESVDQSNIQQVRSVAGEGRKGGMRSKVAAAYEAASAGIDAHVAHAVSDYAAVIGGQAGTHFVAQNKNVTLIAGE